MIYHEGSRRLQDRFGADLNMVEKLEVPIALQRLLDGNEDYWERGAGRRPPASIRPCSAASSRRRWP